MRDKTVARISVGLNQSELTAFEDALRIFYRCERVDPRLESLDSSLRTRLVRIALWAVCRAIKRQRLEDEQSRGILECKLRFETEQEIAERCGRPVPWPGSAPEDSAFSMEWFRKHFPHRCV